MNNVAEMNKTGVAFMRHISLALASSCLAFSASAAFVRTIPAPNGVGDVVALTNVLKTLNEQSQNNRANARIWLTPGVYDLSGIKMINGSHLFTNPAKNAMIAGTGGGPGDTVLLGGGETDKCRIIYTSGGTATGVFCISNLTMTGGYNTSWGGAMYDCSNSTNKTTECRYCIITNNYAEQDGGGMGCGRAYNCLFANNTGRQGGGMITSGMFGKFDDYGGGAWDCVFSNNVSFSEDNNRHGGGGIHFTSGGHCERCKFYGNTSKDGSAITFRKASYEIGRGDVRQSMARDCEFICNTNTIYGAIGVVWCAAEDNAIVSNCVFRANKARSHQLLHGLDMFDCSIADHVPPLHLFVRCNLTRCVVSNNVYNAPSSGASGYAIDKCDVIGACTNVNCLFVGNQQNGTGHISEGKTLVNCTYVKNVDGAANYGGICRSGQMFNCIFTGNKRVTGVAMDVRMIYNPTASRRTNAVSMVNCAYTACDYDFPAEDAEKWGFTNCVKTANLFVNAANGSYTLRPSSPARNAGLASDWILSLLGETDLAGNPRVQGGSLDMGAYQHVPRGMILYWQ